MIIGDRNKTRSGGVKLQGIKTNTKTNVLFKVVSTVMCLNSFATGVKIHSH